MDFDIRVSNNRDSIETIAFLLAIFIFLIFVRLNVSCDFKYYNDKDLSKVSLYELFITVTGIVVSMLELRAQGTGSNPSCTKRSCELFLTVL
jgi:hypothetical protein